MVSAAHGSLKPRKSKFSYPDTTYPFLSVSHRNTADLPSPADPSRSAPFAAGETVEVRGINYPPGMDLPIGLYRQHRDGLKIRLIPLNGDTVRVNPDGSFWLALTLAEDLPAGSYRIIPILEPTQGSDYRPNYAFSIQIG